MLGPVGQQRALIGLALGGESDLIALLHRDMVLGWWPVDPGFPMLDNRDAGNPGRGTLVITWRATLPESVIIGNVATRVQVWGSDGKLVVQEDFSTPVAKDPGKVFLVYINQHIR